MFILILIIHLLIPSQAYAQTVTPPANTPTSSIATQVPTTQPTTVLTDTPVPTVTSAPTPTIIDTPIPTDTIAPTVTGDITPALSITPVASLSAISTTTGTPTPQPTSNPLTIYPTWTGTPVKPIAKTDPPTPTPLPIIPAIFKGASETFSPDVTFPKSFLQFEKDSGNLYASTQLSPSQTRKLLLVSLFLILCGFGLIIYRKIFALFQDRQASENPDLSYAVSEATN